MKSATVARNSLPDLLRGAGLQIAIGSSAKKDELERYLTIAGAVG
jgi:hypothetical protein